MTEEHGGGILMEDYMSGLGLREGLLFIDLE
jgi:hypothetical protein